MGGSKLWSVIHFTTLPTSALFIECGRSDVIYAAVLWRHRCCFLHTSWIWMENCRPFCRPFCRGVGSWVTFLEWDLEWGLPLENVTIGKKHSIGLVK